MADAARGAERDAVGFDDRVALLAYQNSGAELRREINGLVGISRCPEEQKNAGFFNKEELATLVLALGGPQEDGDG